MWELEKKIIEIGKILTFRVQVEKKGFGHAILQAADFCGDEPVLLLLGDTIYRSGSQKTCSEQIIEAYEQLAAPIVSIHKTPVDKVVHYGILSGKWEDKSRTVMKVSEFVEKPTVEYAKDFLGVKGVNGKDSYYSVFGQYVLTPEVFVALKENISAATEKSGEFGLTGVLASFIDSSANSGGCGLYGVVLDGRMFDTGNAEAYRDTMREF